MKAESSKVKCNAIESKTQWANKYRNSNRPNISERIWKYSNMEIPVASNTNAEA